MVHTLSLNKPRNKDLQGLLYWINISFPWKVEEFILVEPFSEYNIQKKKGAYVCKTTFMLTGSPNIKWMIETEMTE